MISIVIPVYNGEKYIDECVKSILVQTYQDWELLLIDNASTDNSLQLCKKIASHDDRIEVLQQHRNMGVSVARNLGIEKARGDYITFVDVDDWIEKEYLENLLETLEKNEADMVICDYTKSYDADRQSLAVSFNPHKDDKYSIDKNKRVYYSKRYDVEGYLEDYFLRGNTHCWGVLYGKKLLEGVFFPKGISIGEDMLFLLEVAKKAQSIIVTDYKGYFYYINETGAMNKKFTVFYMDQITCWEKALQIIEKEYPKLKTMVESILVISILLVVGKLSQLSKEERKEYEKEEMMCYQSYLKYAKNKEIRKYLPGGYGIKSIVYQFLPKLYVALYGKLRK